MWSMFANCGGLKSINISSFNTSNVTTMTGMFNYCTSLESLDLSSFDTSKVTFMPYMFANCYNLSSLNLSNFDTDHTTDMANMFTSSTKLNHLIIGDKTKFKDGTEFNPLNQEWINLDNYSDETESIPSTTLLSKSNPGNWIAAVTYDTSSNTLNIPNDVDTDVDTITVPKASIPKYANVPFTVTVTPKPKTGYTTDKEATINVVATTTTDENEVVTYQLTTPDKIHYTKDKEEPTHNNGGGGGSSRTTEPDKPTTSFKNSVQYLTVDPTVAEATLYNSEGKVVTSEALARNSDWYSNRIMTRDNVKYYQVATDKYVKASDVYLYQGVSDVVKTHDQEVTYLSTIAGKQVTNRGLARLTEWKADKIVTINGQKYYRVATSEFVNAEDVDVIE